LITHRVNVIVPQRIHRILTDKDAFAVAYLDYGGSSMGLKQDPRNPLYSIDGEEHLLGVGFHWDDPLRYGAYVEVILSDIHKVGRVIELMLKGDLISTTCVLEHRGHHFFVTFVLES
jgi:hypothetical protein